MAAGTNKTMGVRIRRLRRRLGKTLEAVATAAGITRSMLSKIENARALPAVATLSRLAAALGVDAAALLEEPAEESTIFEAASSGPLTRTGKGYSFRAIALRRAGKIMQPYLFVARRGQVRRLPVSHAGEEFIYVLQGRMRYRVGSEEFVLGPGDSLYFDAEDKHDLTPLSAEVQYLGIFVERPQSSPGKRKSNG